MAAKTCDYFARWEFDENTDMIDFTVKSVYTDKWTGIGFSDTPQMVNMSEKIFPFPFFLINICGKI